jgi:hypothetical protein
MKYMFRNKSLTELKVKARERVRQKDGAFCCNACGRNSPLSDAPIAKWRGGFWSKADAAPVTMRPIRSGTVTLDR